NSQPARLEYTLQETPLSIQPSGVFENGAMRTTESRETTECVHRGSGISCCRELAIFDTPTRGDFEHRTVPWTLSRQVNNQRGFLSLQPPTPNARFDHNLDFHFGHDFTNLNPAPDIMFNDRQHHSRASQENQDRTRVDPQPASRPLEQN